MFDIFISYKNDPVGILISKNIAGDLQEMGYAVYHNSDENHTGEFDKRLYETIGQCRDFLLIVSEGCLAQLMRHEPVDWVREELLCARANNKNIIPVLVEGVTLPKDKNDMPEDLRFLPLLESVSFPLEYHKLPPFQILIGKIDSRPSKDAYRDVANGNAEYDLHKDFLETLKKAESGDAEAMFEIGCMYYHGFATKDGCDGKTDYAEAAKWFQRAEAHNTEIKSYIEALIGNLYYRGQIPSEEQSFTKALEYYEMAAENSSYRGYQDKIGFMRSEGFGNLFNYDQIVDLYDKIKEDCSVNAKYNMAKFYINYGQFRKAVEILESMDVQLADAEYRLGILYQRGVHCDPPKPDMYRAIAHLRNAAETGHTDALHALGLIYFRGSNGVRQDMRKAKEYYQRAAKQGSRSANYDYAWMCAFGLGGPRDVEEAILFFERAAEKGHHLSMIELAQLYQEPECRNYQRAFEWAQRGAESEDPTGEFILGNLYFFGRGCEADVNKARLYYHKADAHGCLQARFMLKKAESVIMKDAENAE